MKTKYIYTVICFLLLGISTSYGQDKIIDIDDGSGGGAGSSFICPTTKVIKSFVTTGVTNTTVSLSWLNLVHSSASASSRGIMLVYGLGGFDPNNTAQRKGTIYTESSAWTVSSLTPGTVYDFYIKLTCQNTTLWYGLKGINTTGTSGGNGSGCPTVKIGVPSDFTLGTTTTSSVTFNFDPAKINVSNIYSTVFNKDGVLNISDSGTHLTRDIVPTDNSFTIGGLAPNTAYVFYFKNKCQSNTLLVGPVFGQTKPEIIAPVDLKDTPGTSFRPMYEKKYIISGWVKEKHQDGKARPEYKNSVIRLSTQAIENDELATPVAIGDFSPKGNIIDGWQRIEEVFVITTPTKGELTPNNLIIELVNSASDITSYFDDIRIFPLNGSMKSFVYDNKTKKLMAELDENNFATYYEYDKEGGLVRVKKETTRGIFTIQETRSSNAKN